MSNSSQNIPKLPTTKSPKIKFIVGMVKQGRVEMFIKPTEHNSKVAAEHSAYSMACQHAPAVFEVFKRVSAFGPHTAPIKKVEYK